MKEGRIIERQQSIANGLISDPDVPTRLKDAVDIHGTCDKMRPEFEVLERTLQKNVDPMELNEKGEDGPAKMVKACRRPAAGVEQPLPSDILSQDVLEVSKHID
jgi:hypothetical protein